jgi:hypothetical protein
MVEADDVVPAMDTNFEFIRFGHIGDRDSEVGSHLDHSQQVPELDGIEFLRG